MKEKKNEIFITKSREGYSLRYRGEDKCTEPRYVINSRGFYDIITGLIDYLPKNLYKEGIKKIYFNEWDNERLSKKEKKIFKGLTNIFEKYAQEKNLEYKIKEIKKILIKKDDKEKFLEMERLRNKKESFNSLYKITKQE